MPDYVAGFMNMLANGPGPLDPKSEAQIAQWLEHKAKTYENALPGDPRAAQWLENDKARYTQHANELATHAAAAKAMERSKTMLIGLPGLSGQANNPGMPDRLDPEWVRSVERPTMSPEAFAIERLGVVFDTGAAAGPIDPSRWALLADKDSMATDDTIRLCLDAPPELTSATFSIAGVRADGLLHGSVRHHVQASKLTELVATAKKLCDGHGVDLILPPNSPARAWKPDMLAAGVPLDEMTGPEYAEACGNIRVKVAEGGIRHRGQPDLSAAIDGLAVHRSGDLEVWARRSSKSNIAPFVALTCALHRVPVPSEESAFVSLILGG